MTPYPVDIAPDTPVRVGRISYMNVAPIYWGLDTDDRPDWMDMISAPPATLNDMLARGELDVSPVSSAAYARHQDKWLLLPDLSISCVGPVMSVLLISRRPMDTLDGCRVLLTRESATAAALTRYLFAVRGIRPVFETGKIPRMSDFSCDTDAALVIGDAALKENWRETFAHVHDLGEMWWAETGLPFVFAVWAARKSFARKHPERVSAIVDRFDRSRREGLARMSCILPEACRRLHIPARTCKQYYDRLKYDLTPAKVRGFETFFAGLFREGLIPKPVTPRFFHDPRMASLNGRAA